MGYKCLKYSDDPGINQFNELMTRSYQWKSFYCSDCRIDYLLNLAIRSYGTIDCHEIADD